MIVRRRTPFVCAVTLLIASAGLAAPAKKPQGNVGVPTTTTVVSSKNPSTLGEAVTFTATVVVNAGTGTTNAPSAAPVGGSVTFRDGGTPIAAAVPIDAGGVASLSTSSLTAGPHNITAQYGGAAGFAASTSAILVQTVNAQAAPVVVPTLGGAGLALLGLALAGAALWMTRRA
jgi:hypothetical protein